MHSFKVFLNLLQDLKSSEMNLLLIKYSFFSYITSWSYRRSKYFSLLVFQLTIQALCDSFSLSCPFWESILVIQSGSSVLVFLFFLHPPYCTRCSKVDVKKKKNYIDQNAGITV